MLSEMPLAQRVYNSIVNSPRAKALPQWRLTDIGGPAISRVIVRSSGKPLNEGVEGIFTWDGFNNVFLDEALAPHSVCKAKAGCWGARGEAEQTETALVAMSRDVLDLYYTDYISRYDQILGDIDIIPMESLSHAVEVTNVLSGPTSPLVNILNAISDETKLTESRSVDASASGRRRHRRGHTRSAIAAVQPRATAAWDAAIKRGRGRRGCGTAAPPPGSFVEDRFSRAAHPYRRDRGPAPRSFSN
ncbi:ImcF-related family protein [Tateyamaria armeniaca]|uniref:ImcF-related family protein n=1 Tax=Tateyamaria armeniaca TaxID=2518930 RepID=A0ABW8V4T4_9RHOB